MVEKKNIKIKTQMDNQIRKKSRIFRINYRLRR